jgi:hypothetical protein
MAQQLALFRTAPRRQPPPKEFAKCCVIADVCRRFARPGWEWTHLPFGELRTPATAARLQRMGVNGGWPDYLFLSPAAVCHWVEVKRSADTRSDDQRRLGELFERNDVPYLVASDVGLILRTLQAWGVLIASARF